MSTSQEFDTNSYVSEITLDAWIERHSVAFDDTTWSDEQFNGFMNAQVYPNFLRTEAIKQTLETRLLKTDYGRVGMCFFDGWRNYDLRDKQFEDDDRYELQTWLMQLAYSWMSSMSKRNMKQPSYACKHGVENIIELAFQLRAGANQVWQQDAELVLPDEPNAVIADSIACMHLPTHVKRRFEDVKPSYPFSWSYSNKPESIITFVFIASKDDRDEKLMRDRLQMCFYSAQKHRRALCCEDAPVFGMTLHGGILDLYVSFWEGATLSVRPIFCRYALGFFSHFIECYFALCRISEYTTESIQEQLVQWKTDLRSLKEKVRQASSRPWRNKARDDLGPNVCVADEIGNDNMTNAGIDASCLNRIRDRKARIFVESVRQSRYSTETGYPMTRKNIKAFDIVMSAEETEQAHIPHCASAWAEETYLYRGEYDDPAPFSPDDSEEQDVREDSRTSAQPEADSENENLAGRTCCGASLLAPSAGNAETRDSRCVLLLPTNGLEEPSTSLTNQHAFKNSVPFLDCTSIRVC